MNATNTCARRQANARELHIARHTVRSTIIGVCPDTFRLRSAKLGLTRLRHVAPDYVSDQRRQFQLQQHRLPVRTPSANAQTPPRMAFQ